MKLFELIIRDWADLIDVLKIILRKFFWAQIMKSWQKIWGTVEKNNYDRLAQLSLLDSQYLLQKKIDSACVPPTCVVS